MLVFPLARSGQTAQRLAVHCRRLHLSSNGAATLVRKELPGLDITQISPNDKSVAVKIFGSRAHNVPILQLDAVDGGTAGIHLDMSNKLPSSEVESSIKSLNLPTQTLDVLQGLWSCWISNDLLKLTAKIACGAETKLSDLHVVADDFALHRNPHLGDLGDPARRHPLEVTAAKSGLFYHKVQGGNIGCYGYGAGVAMSTMDALTLAGGSPANFLDGGGGATPANVRAALELLFSDPDVKVIFINSFGGLTKMDLIADGLVEILRERKTAGKVTPRIVARLRGTGEDAARRILAEAKDVTDVHYEPELREAASVAVELSGGASRASTTVAETPRDTVIPVHFSRNGPYETTAVHFSVERGDPVMIVGTGKASLFHNKVAQDYGTNIVGATAPGKRGQTFLNRPVFDTIREGVVTLRPKIASLFVPPHAAADAIIESIEAEIPLIVAMAEGIPSKDQLRVQHALRSQSKSRLVGANCPGIIFPHARIKLGIQPLVVHQPGYVGLASRSGTISYELASLTTGLGAGQSVVFGLGGDPFPGTRTWEALHYMLEDPKTRIIALVGEIGGQMEEEAAVIYEEYVSKLGPGETAKPVVGFIAGQKTLQGLTYGHAGAVWWDEAETAQAKMDSWRRAGFKVASTIADVGPLIQKEMASLGL